MLLEVGNTRAGFEEGRVARFGVFGEDAEFGFEEVGVDGDQGGVVEQFLDGVKVVRIFAVAIQPRDDTPPARARRSVPLPAERHRFRSLCASSESVMQVRQALQCTPEAIAFDGGTLNAPMARHEAL